MLKFFCRSNREREREREGEREGGREGGRGREEKRERERQREREHLHTLTVVSRVCVVCGGQQWVDVGRQVTES